MRCCFVASRLRSRYLHTLGHRDILNTCKSKAKDWGVVCRIAPLGQLVEVYSELSWYLFNPKRSYTNVSPRKDVREQFQMTKKCRPSWHPSKFPESKASSTPAFFPLRFEHITMRNGHRLWECYMVCEHWSEALTWEWNLLGPGTEGRSVRR